MYKQYTILLWQIRFYLKRLIQRQGIQSIFILAEIAERFPLPRAVSGPILK